MTSRTIYKTLLKTDPGQARKQLEELAGELAPEDNAAGERLRAVAVELVRRGLEVTIVDYQDASQELEAVLPQAGHLEPVIVDRDASGAGCQLAWEQWADIADEAGAGRAADMVAALLHSIALHSAQSRHEMTILGAPHDDQQHGEEEAAPLRAAGQEIAPEPGCGPAG